MRFATDLIGALLTIAMPFALLGVGLFSDYHWIIRLPAGVLGFFASIVVIIHLIRVTWQSIER